MKRIMTVAALACVMMIVSCTNKEDRQALQQQQRTIDSLKVEMVKKQVVDSMNAVAKQQALVSELPAASPVYTTYTVNRLVRHTARHRSARGTATGYANANTYYGAAPAAYNVQQRKKKGWSTKAKGTLIGAGAGIVTGVIADKKNRGAGALIGGLIGAAAGLGTGAVIDYKQGR
jgi:hypothetical protein